MGNRVIIATIIVGLAFMMFASAIAPAMAQPETDSHAAKACEKISAKMAQLVGAGKMDPVKAAEIVGRVCG